MSSKATCKSCLQVQAEAARLRARVAELEAKVNDATENLLPLVVSWAFQYASEHGLNTAVHDVHKKLILPWLTQEQSERIFPAAEAARQPFGNSEQLGTPKKDSDSPPSPLDRSGQPG